MTKRAAAVTLALALLSACDQPRSSTHDLADAADANSRTALERIESLRSRVDQLEQDKTRLETEVIGLQRDVATLEATVDQHAHVANDNAAREMTHRGACGTETVQVDGGYVTRNRRCTRADLAP